MSNMTYVRSAFQDELSSKVDALSKHQRLAHWVRSEAAPSVLAIVASVVIMTGLIAFRLLWLIIPASIDFRN